MYGSILFSAIEVRLFRSTARRYKPMPTHPYAQNPDKKNLRNFRRIQGDETVWIKEMADWLSVTTTIFAGLG